MTLSKPPWRNILGSAGMWCAFPSIAKTRELIANNGSWIGGMSTSKAEIAFAGADVRIPPAVYTEVVMQGGTRPDARIAARLLTAGSIRVVDATEVGEALEDLQHYQLGRGEQEALTLTARLGSSAVMVTDDFLALIVANRLRVSCQLLLDFVVGRATRGELTVTEAQHIVQAVSPRYPSRFVPHSLAMLRRLS
jgi:predicted nucleic acid-binding protein